MNSIVALLLLTSAASRPSVHNTKAANSSVTYPVFADMPQNPNGLTLYDQKGEVVAQCEKKDDTFSGCKMESNVTLDDLMNAWVHAYLDVQK